uniref:serine/threonine-protein kinase BLUS1-like isoform X2 n=1 Tax=Erigeron canadensis TaxID=72917 RepID=UPI001CB9D1D8|nr:serine/threonine-protein kinase BLUS1-like isoform X2 [Erigeron canadensis]
MEAQKRKFPVNATDYKLYEEIGEGVSASVYRALCVPLNETVAIKVLDMERCNNDLDGIRREVQTMSLINHPNLLRAYCSFTVGHNLWVVMPYMAGGSCLHIMKSSFPDGFEESVIAALLKEVLKALVYLHAHGHIHRDVKAGNILADFNGSIKLADFGVSACMFDGDRQRSRNTFVGTPCWMAPEVMQQLHGYDFKADIWSFGITALELAHGHAPFSKYPPMKVLLMTLQNAPPGLDYERDKKFSKSFKDMVATCLVKDPKKRPSADKLLKHQFFKHTKTTDYLERAILKGLSSLGDRFKVLKTKEADLLVQNKELYGDKEHLSQQEYIRGISAWNFNLEDLKNQAELINDFDENSDGDQKPSKQQNGVNGATLPAVKLSAKTCNNHSDAISQDTADEISNMENPLVLSSIKARQAPEGCSDICEDDMTTVSSTELDETPLDTEQVPVKLLLKAKDQETETNDFEHLNFKDSVQKTTIHESRKYMSGSLLPDNVLSPTKLVSNGERELFQPRFRVERNYSGPLQHLQKNSMTSSSSVEDLPEGVVVTQKGRFKVTEAGSSPKAPILNSSLVGMDSPSSSIPAASLVPSLQNVLQHNTAKMEGIRQLIKFVDQPSDSSSGNPTEYVDTGNNSFSQIPLSPRERELQSQVSQLQQRIESLVEQLQRQKMRNAQVFFITSCQFIVGEEIE